MATAGHDLEREARLAAERTGSQRDLILWLREYIKKGGHRGAFLPLWHILRWMEKHTDE